jgi:formylglycine-generating enzyme required for sulfatase activity
MRKILGIQSTWVSKLVVLSICMLLFIQVGRNFKNSLFNWLSGWTARGKEEHLPPKPPPSIPPPDLSTIQFVSIPGGTTRLGSLKSEPGRNSSMERMKTVSVDSIFMSWSEITRAQWYSIMDPTRTVSPSEANYPMTNITWHEAVQFCQILTISTGVVHRLPTESEWEHAARAGSEEMLSTWKGNCSLSEAISSFHRGDTGKLIRGIKISCNVDSGNLLQVGQFVPNAFGLVDMHGNCWEWIALEDTLTSPPSPLHAPIRGGSAISTNPLECRSANRAWQLMSASAISIGFRVVRENMK